MRASLVAMRPSWMQWDVAAWVQHSPRPATWLGAMVAAHRSVSMETVSLSGLLQVLEACARRPGGCHAVIQSC